ncbi:MAG: DUF72 domain-containing protein [Solirubrobacteraceae bacterium]
MARVVVGTSSWTDPGFVEDWYPADLPARERLAFYAERFEAVEVNATHYAIPAPRTVARWAQVTPEDFTFDVKLHKLLSRHRAELRDLPRDLRERAETDACGRVLLTPRLEDTVLDACLEALDPLGAKLSSLLLQLTPAFSPKDHALDELARLVKRAAPHPLAIELRHRGWLEGDRLEETLAWFEHHGAVFVCVDGPEGRSPTIVPNVDAVTHERLAYVRAHGRNARGYMSGRSVAERFDHVYGADELGEIAGRTERLGQDAREVRVMFNNNKSSYAPEAAEQLRELLGQTVEA